jgi:sugar lactone lactonase YvrE
VRTGKLVVGSSLLLLAGGIGLVAPTPASAVPGFTVIASGLDNPRDLAFGPDGSLYVAEAGNGGVGTNDCLPGEGGPEGGPTCINFSGAITRVWPGGVHRVVTGLFSVGDGSGFGATGADGLDIHGNGGLYTIITGAPQFVGPNDFSAAKRAQIKAQIGQLIKGTVDGTWKAVAGVGSTDFQWTQDHQNLVPDQYPDANPYGVLAESGVQYVVDAAANTLDEVRPNGAVSVIAWFPNPPVSDAVPTCLDRGPDGALYVGQLTGAGNGAGAASIWRVVPGQDPVKWATGLSAITGCGFGPDGQFYAVEFGPDGFENAAPGQGLVVRVPQGSTSPVTVASGLSFPGGFAAGPDGSLYTSNWSIAPSNSGGGPVGQVVKIG